jgi:uncharacterized protein (DUF4415 family)
MMRIEFDPGKVAVNREKHGVPLAERSDTMPNTRNRPKLLMPTAEEDRAITAAANADPDAQPLRPSQLEAMVPLRSLRGRPRSARRKSLVSVRYSAEVLEFFRSTGKGWQSRMDGVLRRYVSRQAKSV